MCPNRWLVGFLSATLALTGCGQGDGPAPKPKPKLATCRYKGTNKAPKRIVDPHPENRLRQVGTTCAEAAQLWALGPAAMGKRTVYPQRLRPHWFEHDWACMSRPPRNEHDGWHTTCRAGSSQVNYIFY